MSHDGVEISEIPSSGNALAMLTVSRLTLTTCVLTDLRRFGVTTIRGRGLPHCEGKVKGGGQECPPHTKSAPTLNPAHGIDSSLELLHRRLHIVRRAMPAQQLRQILRKC